MKYILVSGGVISGIGKGVISSTLGTILKLCGKRVTSIKIDPYINIDAGTFSPYEHGEVFVLADGSEVDLDLGNYERFMDVTLDSDNNITTGKIYQQVINRERKGDYLGTTVQVVPHITDAIQDWVERVAKHPVTSDGAEPEICIIELGGTVGDMEGLPFVEAFRQFQFRVKKEHFCNIHVSLVPQPRSTGEHKTKPTQQSVCELRGLGLSPDLIVCRSENPIENSVKVKIANFCHVQPNKVMCIADCSSIYRVPLEMHEQGVVEFLQERLQLNLCAPLPLKAMAQWQELADKYDRPSDTVTIGLVGKYTELDDAYASVIKALQHASLAANLRLKLKSISSTDLEQDAKRENPALYHEAWRQLCNVQGIIVPGGFGERGLEGKVAAAEWCRLNHKPYLGVCLGMQVAVVEFARNVLNLEGANSTEFDQESKNPVVIDMPEHNQGDMGGTMRLGRKRTLFKKNDSLLRQLYGGVDYVDERHRHRYEVNPAFVEPLEKAGLCFVGIDETGQRMECLEMEGHPFFVGVQFHPEYQSGPLRPSAPYVGLILASSGQLQSYLDDKSISPNKIYPDSLTFCKSDKPALAITSKKQG